MKVAKLAVRSDRAANNAPNEKSATSALRLRLLLNDLIHEIELLERSVIFSGMSPLENRKCVNFYAEVERFETALIRSALRRTNGHQLEAARLLNLNPSTLNAKIKQYHIRSFFYDDESGK